MPRPPREPESSFSPTALLGWAEAIGEALGRGVARGINHGLAAVSAVSALPAPARKRGRPPKPVILGPLPPERRCKVEGCEREVRSRGFCSAHYQAERRKSGGIKGAAS